MVKITAPEIGQTSLANSYSPMIMEYAFGNDSIDRTEVLECAKAILTDGDGEMFENLPIVSFGICCLKK